MSKENFPIKDAETGKEYWISRSCAVVAVIVAEEPKTGELYVLVGKRGPGCPDYIGRYAFVCGYLNWQETREQALIREVKEEIDLDITDCDIMEWKTVDDPEADPRENICTRYIVIVDYDEIKSGLENGGFDLNSEERGGEKDETSDLKLIPVSEVDSYDWAFNHAEVIKSLPKEIDTVIAIWNLKGKKNSL